MQDLWRGRNRARMRKEHAVVRSSGNRKTALSAEHLKMSYTDRSFIVLHQILRFNLNEGERVNGVLGKGLLDVQPDRTRG